MSKVLIALMAELMTYFTKAHQLITTYHFGGRLGRTNSEAVQLLQCFPYVLAPWLPLLRNSKLMPERLAIKL